MCGYNNLVKYISMGKPKKYAIAFGYTGKIFKEIKKTWTFLEGHLGIKFMSRNHAPPHITVISGEVKNDKKVIDTLKKMKMKKFKLISPGLGIFANEYPNLYIRWELNGDLIKNSEKIRKNFVPYFYKLFQASNNSLWVPKTTLAWRDLKYQNLNFIFKNLGYMFKKKSVLINCIYLIDFTDKEKLKHMIKLR